MALIPAVVTVPILSPLVTSTIVTGLISSVVGSIVSERVNTLLWKSAHNFCYVVKNLYECDFEYLGLQWEMQTMSVKNKLKVLNPFYM